MINEAKENNQKIFKEINGMKQNINDSLNEIKEINDSCTQYENKIKHER